MQRRHFLKTAGAAAGLAAVPFANALADAVRAPRMVLLRAPAAVPGTAFLPVSRSACEACADEALQVSIGRLQAADGGPVLEDLAVSAMFDLPDGSSVPFVAWRYAAGPVPSQTDGARFVADRSTMRRLELDFCLAGDRVPGRAHCSLAAGDSLSLSPGHYVLIGPRRDGSSPDLEGLVHSGQADSPLGLGARRDFDYLPIRIEAIA